MVKEWKSNEIRILVPSNLDWLSVVDRAIEGLLEPVTISEEDANAISISIAEAGTNAVQHGLGEKSARPVEFSFMVCDNEFRAIVRDWGPGFDIDQVLEKDPTSPEGLLAPRGRGIFIMKSLMDEVSFKIVENEGCWVSLSKSWQESC